MVHRYPSENFSQEALKMKNLLALVGLVVVGFAGAGWYLGWYKLDVQSSNPTHPKVGVEFERDKIENDLKNGVKRVGGVIQQEVQGTPTSRPVVPTELPPLPEPPPPPPFNSGVTVPPVNIPLPPPPSLPPIK
jgi:hypothetical protein